MAEVNKILEVKDLLIERAGFSLSVPSLFVGNGEIVGLVGSSGSGKTTLFNTLAGFNLDFNGEIIYQGKNISNVVPEKRKIALLFQKGVLFPHWNVFENVEFALKIQGIENKQRKEKVVHYLKKLKIDHLSKKAPVTLSGGEAQRVSLARALITGFSLILLDEPFSALDYALKVEFRELLKNTAKDENRSMLLVSHDEKDIEVCSSRFYLIKNGQVTEAV